MKLGFSWKDYLRVYMVWIVMCVGVLVIIALDESAGVLERPLALHWAAAEGKLWRTKLLLAMGKTVQDNDARYWGPIHYAIRNGHRDVVDRLLSHNKHEISHTTPSYTPVMIAVRARRPNMVRHLVSRGASLHDSPWNSNISGLDIAARQGNSDMCRLLLDLGASHHSRGSDYRMPWQLALLYGHDSLFDMLYLPPVRRSPSPLAWAAYLNKKALCERFLSEPNSDPSERQIALYWAIKGGSVDMVRLLIEHGIDITASTPNGTPLYMAASGGHAALVRFLIDQGAPVNGQTSWGETPLEGALRSNKVVRALLARGACPAEGWSKLLKEESWMGGTDVYKLLLEAAKGRRPRDTASHAALAQSQGKPIPGKPFRNSQGMRMLWLPNVSKDSSNHGVWMSVGNVTQEQFEKLLGYNPSTGERESSHGVNWVTLADVLDYCEILSKKEKRGYRIPTEIEWKRAIKINTPATGFHDLVGVSNNLGNWCVTRLNPDSSVPEHDFDRPLAKEDYVWRKCKAYYYEYSYTQMYQSSTNQLPDQADIDLGFRLVLASTSCSRSSGS